MELANQKVVKYAAIWTSAAAVAYWVYWNYHGRPSSKKRKDLEEQLFAAQRAVCDLEQKLITLEQQDKPKKEIRLWMDGAFDMMHFGHMNAFRQARSLGTYLIAGVCGGESITTYKGSPICSDKERCDVVRGCKWVDEVMEDVPYLVSDEYLLDIVQRYRIDFVVHGDDPCIVNGKNAYEGAIKLGKYLTIPRTEGVSTTDIVGRMLMLTSSHHDPVIQEQQGGQLVGHLDEDALPMQADRKSSFLTTSSILRLFSAGIKPAKPTDRVVYICGSWDMFHAGHVEALQKAKALGDYVIVGIWNDAVVNTLQGMNLPILSLHERVLSVLGCKWVDDVLIDAPYTICAEMLASLHIAVVVQSFPNDRQEEEVGEEDGDCYALPRSLGILQTIYTDYNLSAMDFVERIQHQRERYSDRFAKKMQQEMDFYKNKYNL